jgi:hypothetical protein
VLTTLPRPLDPTTGAYIVGEVYGYAPGSKKRKRRRAELTVGIDGEAINIYDVSSLPGISIYMQAKRKFWSDSFLFYRYLHPDLSHHIQFLLSRTFLAQPAPSD